MALEVFKLKGSIYVDTDKAEKSISKVDSKASKMAKTLAGGVKKFAKFGAVAGAGASAVVAGITSLATSAADTADRIDKLSAKTGMSKKAFQEWDYVMSQNGMDVEKMQVGMKTLVNQMDAAMKGSKNATGAFDALGVSITDASGNMRSQEEVMNDAVAALASMEDGAERAKLASTLFGKAGQEMAPMLNTGVEGINELKDRAHELGLVMSDESVDAGVVLGDTMEDVKSSFGALATKIGVEAMPIVQKALDFIIEKMPAIQKTVKNVFSKISGFWKSYGRPVFNTLSKSVRSVIKVIQKNFPKIQKTIRKVFNQIGKFWKKTLKPTFVAIKNFIADVLFPIFDKVFNHWILPVVRSVFRTIKRLWNKTLKPVFTAIVEFIGNVFSGDISGAFESVVTIIKGIWDGLVEVIKTPINTIIEIINSFIGGIISAVNGLIDAINGFQIDVPDWVTTLTGIDTFGFNIPSIPEDAKIPLLAKGGSVNRAGKGVVGEDGPELIELPVGAKVTPLNKNNNAFAKMEKLMDQMVKLLTEVNSNMPDRVVLDTGATVGHLARPMDEALGKIVSRKKRGTK